MDDLIKLLNDRYAYVHWHNPDLPLSDFVYLVGLKKGEQDRTPQSLIKGASGLGESLGIAAAMALRNKEARRPAKRAVSRKNQKTTRRLR